MGNFTYLCQRNNTKQMHTLFKQFLTSKNIDFKNDVEEQITFQLGGFNYLFICEKSDVNYFRIILPNVFQIVAEREKYEKLINEINHKFKVAKTYITGNDMIWIAAEQFVYSNENIDFLFERCVVLLRLITEQFRNDIKAISND